MGCLGDKAYRAEDPPMLEDRCSAGSFRLELRVVFRLHVVWFQLFSCPAVSDCGGTGGGRESYLW